MVGISSIAMDQDLLRKGKVKPESQFIADFIIGFYGLMKPFPKRKMGKPIFREYLENYNENVSYKHVEMQ